MARKKQPPATASPAPATVTPVTTSLCLPGFTPPVFTCSSCRHWKPLEEGLGQCRRYPPTVIQANQLTPRGPIVTFNLTAHDLWCGEHTPVR
jgi:hypothetical protein